MMRRFVKKMTACIAVLALAAGLITGCSGKKPDADTQDEASVQEEKALRLWYTDQGLEPYLTQATTAYKTEKGVEVALELVPAADYAEAISEASISEEGGPDVYIAANSLLETLELAGLTSKVEEYKDIYKEKNFPGTALSAASYKDELIAYPVSYETTCLLYNKNYVETVPATMDEILAFAENFAGSDGVENILKWDVSDLFFDYFFAREYMELGGKNGDDRTVANVDNQKVQECLAYFQSLNQFFSIDAREVTYENVLQEFMDGKTVFIFAKTDAISAIDKAVAAGTSVVPYGAAVLPDLRADLATKGISTTDMAVVNGYTKNGEEAEAFAKYLSYDTADSLYDTTGRIAAREGIAYSNPEIANIMEQYRASVPVAKFMEAGNYWVKTEIAFLNIWAGGDIAAEIKAVADFIKEQLAQ